MLWWTVQNLVITAMLACFAWVMCRCWRIGPVARHALWLVVLLKLLTPPTLVWPWAVRDPISPALRGALEPKVEERPKEAAVLRTSQLESEDPTFQQLS